MTENHPEPGTREFFLARFGSVVEHSPWVAEQVWEQYPSEAQDEDPQGLYDVFGRVIRAVSEEQRIELLRAHPDLACGVISSRELTTLSREEQQDAGLDKCSPEEFIEFQTLNLLYKEQFGFPFIIAVKGMNRHEILDRFRNRIERTRDQEFISAVENVIRIIGFRVEAIIKGHD